MSQGCKVCLQYRGSLLCTTCYSNLGVDVCAKCKKYRGEFLCRDCYVKIGLKLNGLNDFKPADERCEGKTLKFLQKINPHPLNESFTGDVTLKGSGSKGVQAHRFVLAGKSPVFERMFASDSEMEESQTGVVKIADFKLPVLRAMLEYCYTAVVTFTTDAPVEEVIKLAHKYEISDLQGACAENILETFTKENILKRMRLAIEYDLKEVQKAGTEFTKENIYEVLPLIVMGSG